jgi:hypothetical protein
LERRRPAGWPGGVSPPDSAAGGAGRRRSSRRDGGVPEIDAWRNGAAPPARRVVIRSSEGLPYAEVADSGRAPFVRHMLAAIGADEHRLCRWRLDHKLVQAQVLGHYAPEAIPRACGMASFAAQHRRDDLRRALRREFPSGYMIKTALSDSSGSTERWRAARDAYATVRPRAIEPCDERWFAQERIAIAREYRIHTFERAVVTDLTFHRYRADANVARGTNEFVQSILDRLPEGIVHRSFFAWDVARDERGRLAVIEVNVTGVHPVFRPGFQCSGHLQDETTGAWATATLIRHIEEHLGIEIVVKDDARQPSLNCIMYREVAEQLRTG